MKKLKLIIALVITTLSFSSCSNEPLTEENNITEDIYGPRTGRGTVTMSSDD